ncbi:MAG: hypothetical protein IT449_18015 [Phycisphaerales bacterium]|nr:hypothetical protein [Phycisphaerales bacterium]
MMRRHGIRVILLPVVALLMISGCGLRASNEQAARYRELGADGEVLVLDDLLAVAGDPDLTDDQKRNEMRRMGLVDEDVIEALLAAD